MRTKDEIMVQSAWKIFHYDVNVKDMYNPFDILYAFIEKYGKEFYFSGTAIKRKFRIIQNESFLLDGTAVRIHLQGKGSAEAHVLMRISSLQTLEVSIAFAVDMDKYLRELAATNS